MLNQIGRKIVSLAKDILESNLNPSDLCMVIKNEINPSKYTVLEGNRRIIALKLLHNPDLIPAKHSNFKKQFEKLHIRFIENPINQVYCVVYQNINIANKWIKLKHTGENNGVGTVGWDGQSTARFRSKYETKKLSEQAIDIIIQHKIFDKEIEAKIRSISITNLDRILNDPHIRDYLGLKSIDKELKIINHKQKTLIKLKQIFLDLIEKRIVVSDIYSKEQRLDYIDDLEMRLFHTYIDQKISSTTTDTNPNQNSKINMDNLKQKNSNKEVVDINASSNKKDLKNKVEPTSTNTKETNPKVITCFFEDLTWIEVDVQVPDNIGLIQVAEEIIRISKNNLYRKLPIASAFLLRSLLEQTLIYHLNKLNLYNKLTKGNNNKTPQLGNIIKFYSSRYEIIFKNDSTFRRTFQSFADNLGTKDYLDMVIHNPHLISADPKILDSLASSGLKSFIKIVLNKK
ncbi:MAG: hypothetical protein MJA82_14530 [Clostridia bacterium]|nr:hypothetical protein [Clostridia bacterium]